MNNLFRFLLAQMSISFIGKLEIRIFLHSSKNNVEVVALEARVFPLDEKRTIKLINVFCGGFHHPLLEAFFSQCCEAGFSPCALPMT